MIQYLKYVILGILIPFIVLLVPVLIIKYLEPSPFTLPVLLSYIGFLSGNLAFYIGRQNEKEKK